MESLQQLPDASNYFDFSTRRFVGNAKRTLRQVPAAEALKHWELWVSQALAALAKLHDAGYIHGDIDASALIINEDNNLRLGALQKIRRDGDVGIVESFAPNNLLLPPEQNLYAAFQKSIPFDTAFQTLNQANWPMDQLQTIFPKIQFTHAVMFGLYKLVQSLPTYADMQKAGDIWMLAFTLLEKYYEILNNWSYSITSEFYQTKHEAFHDLIEQMVRVNPMDRVGVLKALEMWAPQELRAKPEATPVAPEVAEEAPTSSASSSSPSVTVAPSATAAPSATPSANAQRRPYLTLQSHPAGRNKTRRNPGSSGRNPATGNRAQQAAD